MIGEINSLFSGMMTISDNAKVELKAVAKCLAIGAIFIATMKTLAYLTNAKPSDSSTKSYWDDRDDDTSPTKYEPAREPIVNTEDRTQQIDHVPPPVDHVAALVDHVTTPADHAPAPVDTMARAADKTDTVFDDSKDDGSSWTGYFSSIYDTIAYPVGSTTDLSDWSTSPK